MMSPEEREEYEDYLDTRDGERLNAAIEFTDRENANLLKAVERLEKKNRKLVEVCEDIDRLFSSRQGLDYDYWSQEEKDLHDKARKALAQVGE